MSSRIVLPSLAQQPNVIQTNNQLSFNILRLGYHEKRFRVNNESK